jgi:Holliday junction resolvasome RuvABC endonuclease subunit
MKYLLAIDPGLSGVKVSKSGRKTGSNTGFAQFCDGKLIGTYSLNVSDADKVTDKCAMILSVLQNFENNTIFPHFIVVETSFYQGKANINHQRMMGIIDYEARVDATITPKEVKKLVTGSGNAEKKDMAAALKKHLTKKELKLVDLTDEDVVDAVCIGLAYIIETKQNG